MSEPTMMTSMIREKGLAYWQRLVIFLVVVFMFAVVSVRTEIAQAQINANQERINAANQQLSATNSKMSLYAYRECLIRNENSRNLNRILDAIVVSVKSLPGLTPTERANRIALYTSAKAALFDCGQDPSKR